MAAVRLTCPSCSTTLRLAQEVPAGKHIKCPKCGTAFLASEAGAPQAVSATPPSRPAPTRSNDDDEERRPRRKKFKPKKKQGANQLLIILSIAAAAVLLLGGGIVGAVLLWPGKKSATPVASAPERPVDRNPIR